MPKQVVMYITVTLRIGDIVGIALLIAFYIRQQVCLACALGKSESNTCKLCSMTDCCGAQPKAFHRIHNRVLFIPASFRIHPHLAWYLSTLFLCWSHKRVNIHGSHGMLFQHLYVCMAIEKPVHVLRCQHVFGLMAHRIWNGGILTGS